MSIKAFYSGSAFNHNAFKGYRIRGSLCDKEKTNYVSLTLWCNNNFISKKIGRALLQKRLLIGQRLYGQWWVCANLERLEELLEYMGTEELLFDADNSL